MPYKVNPAGVYCLKTVKTKLVYIGSSKRMLSRWVLHRQGIRNGDTDKTCQRIIDAIYNEGDNCTFEILEECTNLEEREQYWLDYFKKDTEYTLVNVFDAKRLGTNVPDDFRKKMSEVRKEWEENYKDRTTDKSSV